MKGYWSLAIALPLVFVIGCGSDVGNGPNPAPNEEDKAPTTDLAQVSGAGNPPFISEPGAVGFSGGVINSGSVGSYGVGGGGGTSTPIRHPVAQ